MYFTYFSDNQIVNNRTQVIKQITLFILISILIKSLFLKLESSESEKTFKSTVLFFKKST